MKYNEFYQKCNPETRKILKAYTSFMDKRSKNWWKDNIFDLNPTSHIVITNMYEEAIFYLFFICINSNPILKSSLDIELVIPKSIQKDMVSALRMAFYQEEEMDKEFQIAFYADNLGTKLIQEHIDFASQITIERILINIIKNIKEEDIANVKKLFHFDKLLPKLVALTQEKESKNIKDLIASIPPKNPTPSKSYPTSSYGEYLTNKHYEYNPALGRQRELRIMSALLMDEEKSLILHGNPGVGKTALIHGLAYQIQNQTAPLALREKQILGISASELIEGCQFVGLVEKRLNKIINDVISSKNTILFIDEIHTLIGLGQGKNDHNDVANILKPYLGDGRLKLVGATTTEEYNIILENGAFARRFNALEIAELADTEVLKILQFTIDRYQKAKGIGVKYQEEIMLKLLRLILEFSKKHTNALLNQRLYNPDLALTMLRNGYNFAMVDEKDALDVNSLIEGIDSMNYFRQPAKEEFAKKALALTKQTPSLYIP